ncbi:MAG TPA: energy transducer TonB [Polyangia bacterium]|jgi:TonB family protein|nr:energy transducer TonB [Polyangia bacterium]
MPLAKATRPRRSPGRSPERGLGRGALLAFWLHAQFLVPLLIVTWVYASREEAQRAEEVDVAFRDVTDEELADLPPIEEAPPPPRALPEAPDQPRRDEKKKKPKDKARPVKLAQRTPEPPRPKPKPEPEVPIPPMPPMPQEAPPIPKPQDRAHQKMVDLDNDKEVEPPPDAKFLAQKNNRAEVETRAADTNLEKARKGTEGSAAPSERQQPEIGDDKAKIAELDDQKSALGRKAPDVTPHVDPELSQPDPPPAAPRSLLALRDAPRRDHELTPETADPSLPRTPDGTVPMPSDRGVRSPRTSADRMARGKRMKLALTAKDFEYLFGADAAAERRLAQKERSKKVGRFQQRVGRVQSALENFIPEVKPGNQTALNTRAAPFAAFIARMHRSIHKLWGFGMLEDWDEMSGSNPYNNPNLLTTLELVLNGDGTIDNVKMIKASGYLPYDAAAIDVAYSAGPYPDPPREIRSKNGKIYIHWRFFRDARQCATSGVDYFILDNPPRDGDTAAAAGPERPAPAARAAAGEGEGARKLAEGPRHLERNAGEGEHHHQVGGVPHAVGEELPPAPEPSATAPTNFPPRADSPQARALAESWFAAFSRGDVAAMLGPAVYPFRSSGGNAAGKRSTLETMLHGLVDESDAAARTVSSMQIVSPAGLRGIIGRLPQGLDDGSGGLYAVARTGGKDTLILILTRKGADWKVAGLARR